MNFPSAGGLYPLEFYIGVFNVEDIAPGIYHYSLLDQKLTLIRDESFSKGLQVYLEQNKTICNSSFSLLISSSIEVSCAKYANKALQFAFIEMGHVTQNFMLNALEGGISSVAIGGIDSEILNRTLNLDGFIESIEYCCLFGKEEK